MSIQKSDPFNAFRYSDEQIASIVFKICELVEEDARPLLIRHLFEIAYEVDQIGAIFNQRIIPIIKALAEN